MAACKSVALALAAGGVLLAAGCGADRYGHGRVYAPYGGEEAAADGAEELDPVMVRRQPELWAKKKISLFGIVEKRADLPGGKADLTLSVRTLEARNLCESAAEDSCRTTVSDHEHDKLRVVITYADAVDEIGKTSIGTGSLVRVIGVLAPAASGAEAPEAAPVIQATFYRHWPRGFYVTRAAASTLRR